jgi:hypothetical protein
MNRIVLIILLISLFFTVSAFADARRGSFDASTDEEAAIPEGIRNNSYFLESIRLSRLAQETFEFGDYVASASFAQEAIRFAELSDRYVSEQLVGEARRLLTWADNNDIANRFPNNYNEGKNQHDIAVAAQSNEEWDDSINAAIKSIEILAAFTRTSPGTTTGTGTTRQYTVRTWRVERDCLWNIAGYPWVYGDPWRWRELYEANRHRLPDPNNPHLILPGMVLDIP